MATARQIHANRLNARLARGPSSASGKARSSANSLKHGMAARHLTPEEELEALRRRAEQLRATFPPGNDVEAWLLERLAAETLTFERCQRHESALRCHLANRVGILWDEDRRLAALDLAAKLAGDPERIASRLRATSQGCDLMIERWEDLAIVLERLGGWEERHQHRAMDLLGLPVEDRAGDPLGLATMAVEELVALIAAEIDALEARKAEALDQHDADERALAARGEFVDVPKALKLVLRYKAESHRRIAWLESQLQAVRATPARTSGRPERSDSPAAPPPPAPAPPPRPEPRSEDDLRRVAELRARRAMLAAAEAAAASPTFATLGVALAAAPAPAPAAGRPAATPPSPNSARRRPKRMLKARRG